jgi:HK97 gp10 family phage protein
MPKAWVEIEGLKEVLKEFDKMPEKGKAIMHRAVNKAAEMAKPQVESALPVGTDSDTHIKDTVKVSRAKPKKTSIQQAILRIGRGKKADYAFHLETGHTFKNGKRIPAQPTTRKTIDRHTETYATVIAETIFDGMEV